MPPPNTSAPQSAPPATRGDEDPQSPTVMLQAYLRSRGMPLTAQNMQRVLMENARGSADIPGLVSDVPSTDPGVGQQGNVAGKVEQAPTRPVIGPATGQTDLRPADARLATATAPNAATTAGNTTTAAPADAINLGALIAAGAGAGGGMWAANRFGGAGGNTSAAPTPNTTPPGTARVMGQDVPLPGSPVAAAANAAAAGGPFDYTMTNPQGVQLGDRFATAPAPAAAQPPIDPLQAAIARAVQMNASPSNAMPVPPVPAAPQAAMPPQVNAPTAPVAPTAPIPAAPPGGRYIGLQGGPGSVGTEIPPTVPLPDRARIPTVVVRPRSPYVPRLQIR